MEKELCATCNLCQECCKCDPYEKNLNKADYIYKFGGDAPLVDFGRCEGCEEKLRIHIAKMEDLAVETFRAKKGGWF